jgi:channel protein (hemolysin III family)
VHLEKSPPVTEIIPIPGFSHPVSSIVHLVGAGVFFALTFTLLSRARGDIGRLITLGIFSFACVFMLSISGVYHLLSPYGVPHMVFQRIDHAAIFVAIAATFTPLEWILFPGVRRWVMIILVWVLAITGLTLKVIFFESLPEWAGLGMYLGLGWIGVISGIGVWRQYGTPLLKPLILGGLSYTAGAVLDVMRHPVIIPGVIGPHELLHFAVLAGMGFHWRFLYKALEHQPGAFAKERWAQPKNEGVDRPRL